MKRRLLALLQCPSCRSELVADSFEESLGEIKEGELACTECGKVWPITGYVPRFVEHDNYSHSWGKLWEETGGILRDSFTGIPFHRNVVHGHYDESGEAREGSSPFGFGWPANLRGERILEIGPGTGNCSEILVQTGADLLCVEMSHAIDTFPESLLTRENLDAVQGDITTGFLRGGAFDKIWFFQVLQHTPEPPETLRFVRQFLAPAGELAVTSYGGSFNPWYYRHTRNIDDERAWHIIRWTVPLGVRLKYAALRAAARLGSLRLRDLVNKWMGFIDPRNIYYRTLQGQMHDYIVGASWEHGHDKRLLMKYVIINTYDAITPTYTNNCPDLETMERWLADAGYTRFEVWGKGGVRAKAWV